MKMSDEAGDKAGALSYVRCDRLEAYRTDKAGALSYVSTGWKPIVRWSLIVLLPHPTVICEISPYML